MNTASSQRPRTGILGGTFNPVHRGHLRAAEEVIEQLELEKLIFVPCAIPPHKKQPAAPAAQRLKWLRAATAHDPRFEVDPLELDRPGPSYSVETLEILQKKLGGERPVFLLGIDAFRELDTWKEPERLLEFADIGVMTRPNSGANSLEDSLPSCLRSTVQLDEAGLLGTHDPTGAWIRLLKIPALDISATEIRSRLRKGDPVRYLLPDSIQEDVLQSEFYGSALEEEEPRD